MMYVLLILLITVLFIITYKIFNKDLLSPSNISILMFLLSTLLAYIGTFSWNNVSDISFKLVFIIIIGLIAFVLGEFITRKFFHNDKENIQKLKMKVIKIKKWKIIITVIFTIITGIFLILEIKRICSFYGFNSNSIPKLLAFYRTKTDLFSTDLVKDGIKINFLVSQMKKVCEVLCIIFGYIFVNNVILKDKLKNNIGYLIILFLNLLICFTNSGRSIFMHMLVGILMIYIILYYLKNHNKDIKKINKKVFIIALVALILALILFCLVIPLVGRKIKVNYFDYIGFYLGAPIPSFNIFLNKMPIHDSFIGSETFHNLYALLNRLHIVKYVEIGSHNWVKFNYSLRSNIYSSLRCYFYDFGYLGVFLCQFIFGIIYSKFYLKAKNANNVPLLILYGYFSYVLIDQIRDNQFYGLISFATVARIFLIYVLYYFYLKFDFKTWRDDLKNIKEKFKKKQIESDIKNEVVIIGGIHHNMLGVIRSLGEKGIKSNIIVTTDKKFAYITKSKYVKKHFQILEDETKIKEILLDNFINKKNKAILIPTSDFSALFIDKNLKELQKYFIVPNINNKQGKIEELMDKFNQYKLAQKNSIKMAKSLEYDLSKEEKLKDFPIPCIVKPLVSALGYKSDIRICKTKNELIKEIKIFKKKKYEKIIIQEYIDYDYECGLIGCANKDEIIIPGIIKKVRIFPLKTGNNSFSETISTRII